MSLASFLGIAPPSTRLDDSPITVCLCVIPSTSHAHVSQVRQMAEQCAAKGISVKYGKKVLGRLERVGPVREELAAAVQSSDFPAPGCSCGRSQGLAQVMLIGTTCGGHNVRGSDQALVQGP